MTTDAIFDRLIKLETAAAHLDHQMEQLHFVLLAVQGDLKLIRAQVFDLERRVLASKFEEETGSRDDERPPHY